MDATSACRPTPRSVAYVLRSYPRLSQTFILNEIRALERLGVGIRIFAITDPREPITQPEVAEIRAPAHYLDSLGRTWRAILAAHPSVANHAPSRAGIHDRDVLRVQRRLPPEGPPAAAS